MTKTVIQARSISKKYQLGESIWRSKKSNEFWAIQDISFDIQEGDTIGIVGDNGAGKSTLLKILSRITAPTAGQIKVIGKVRSILEVGIGFQGELTGRENIYLNGAMLGMSYKEIKKKYDEIVEFSEIEKFVNTPVKRYSSGMYVRLAFAVAAHLDPDILIIDEVLAVGDIKFQRKCLQKMEEESTMNGRTVIFVSHNLSAIRSLCQRALLLKQGRLIADGAATDVVEKFLESHNKIIDLENRNLADRLNRTTGRARFSNIQTINQKGENSWRFNTGDVFHCELKFKVYETIPNLNVLFFIRSLDKKILTTCKYTLSSVELHAGFEGSVRITIPKLPLRIGEYGLYICLADNVCSSYHDIVDETSVPYLVISTDQIDPELNRGYFSMDYEVTV
jgi:lipopolysaccharide transport system ATP-binding protein